MKTILHLENVVEIETLQKIQDDFSEATGLAAITVDYRGKPITRHSGCSSYCEIIRNREETKDLCEKCDSRAGLEAARTGKPYIYICHSGFLDFAAPIIVNDQYLGAIMGGQVLIAEKETKVKHIIDEKVDIEEDVELIEAYMQIPIVSYKKIEAAANMMFNIANKIAEKGYVNVIQEELHKQSLQLIQSKSSQANLQSALETAELKTLRSQINRQFLIQTLNIIGNLSYIEKAPKTEEATFTFIEIVKFLVMNINKDVLVRDEIMYLDNYLSLQKLRLGNRLTYKIMVDPQAEAMIIPSMMIQPLVENAIVHGLETKEGPGNINVKINVNCDQLIITIEDSGIGMKEAVVKNLLYSKYEGNSSPKNIRVLKRLLKERFDKSANINIHSKEHVGTNVIVTLPCITQFEKQLAANDKLIKGELNEDV